MPSRRDAIALSDTEIRDFLNGAKTLILVSNGKDGFPHPMPMWFCIDDEGRILCTTFRKSQKVLNLTRDAKASLLVESGTEYAELKGVVLYARGEVIDDVDAVTDALVRINSRGRDAITDTERRNLTAIVRRTAEKRVLLRFQVLRTVSWDHAKLGGRY